MCKQHHIALVVLMTGLLFGTARADETWTAHRFGHSTYWRSSHGREGPTERRFGSRTYITMPDGWTIRCETFGGGTYCAR